MPASFASFLRLCAGLVWSASTVAMAQVSASTCGSLNNGFGPYDYRPDRYRAPPGDSQPHKDKLQMVEKFHFPVAVEYLLRGSSIGAGTIAGDLDYTLRAFPNHHRALAAVIRLWERSKDPTPVGFAQPLECYFERALRFRPDDSIARLLYASFLLKSQRKAEAMGQIDVCANEAGENAISHYQVGLLYADAEAYDRALAHAHRAMQLGLAREDLAKRLQVVGQWKDPGPSVPAPAASASGQ